MSVEENKAVIVRLVDSLNNEDWDIFNELMSPDLVDNTAARARGIFMEK